MYKPVLTVFIATGQIEVTNDGATILRNIGVDNPAAKILVNISKIQDDEVSFMPSINKFCTSE